MRLYFLIALLFVLSIPTSAQTTKDAGEIRAHIEAICQAFVDWDVDKIYATHTEDWRGFLEGSTKPIKGVDEYMRANGIDWPKVKGSKPYPNPASSFRLLDFDVHFYSPQLAVASFNVEFFTKADNVVRSRYQIMDLYAKRNGSWIQAASHTVMDPAWRAEQNSKPGAVSLETRQKILVAREAVWRAFFSNDRVALEKMIPEEAIAIDADQEQWSDRTAIFSAAKVVRRQRRQACAAGIPQDRNAGLRRDDHHLHDLPLRARDRRQARS